MLRRLRHDQNGFSLMEMLAAMAIGSIVLTALLSVFTNGITGAARVNDRIEAAQRGRAALDRVTSLLDSQVCIVSYDATAKTDITTAPVLPTVSDDNNVYFYADLNGASDSPDKYRISYDPSAKTLTEYRYDGTRNSSSTLVFPSTPTVTRLLATSIMPARVNGKLTGAQLPIFQYFRYTNSAVDPTPLTTPVSAADAATVVRVGVQFQAISSRTKVEDARSTQVSGQGNVLTSNPITNTVC